MAETYEERVGRELDALYQGALFLTAGNGSDAESLLLETVGDAVDLVPPESPDVSRWFESRLARSFLQSTDPPDLADRKLADVQPLPELQADDLFRAAAAVPSWARAALWLVLLRQWSYPDASEALSVSVGTLRRMLDYRHILLQEMLRSNPAGEMAEGGVT